MPPTCSLALLHVCTGWQAAVEAAPELWPTVVLTAPALGDIDLGEILEAACRPADHAKRIHAEYMQQARDEETSTALDLVNKAAQLSPFAWSVKLEGFDDQVSKGQLRWPMAAC